MYVCIFWIRNWSSIACHLVVLVLLVVSGDDTLQRSLKLSCFKLNADELWQDFRYDIILSRWQPWCHFTKDTFILNFFSLSKSRPDCSSSKYATIDRVWFYTFKLSAVTLFLQKHVATWQVHMRHPLDTYEAAFASCQLALLFPDT